MDETQLYEKRLLVFIETDPQTGEYQQLLLNSREFKKLSDSIGTKVENQEMRDGFEALEIKLSDEKYKLPDLRSIN